MTPERWAEVERLCHAALARPPDRRASFLADECRDDEELRREVESLLAQQDAAETFLERRRRLRQVWQDIPARP
jgi:hypothetical protein